MKQKNKFLYFFKNESLWIKSICAAFILTIVISFLPFYATCAEISDNVFRLHILANSDSEQDQALKMKVRDAVLQKAESIYAGAQSFEEANTAICNNLQSIQQTAEQVLKTNGSNDAVTARVTEKHFTTRNYEDFSLPAGKYRTLQIEIGNANGKNWWCMVYPALCVPASQKTDEEILEEIPQNEKEIITQPQKFEVKFKVVEWLENLKAMLDFK